MKKEIVDYKKIYESCVLKINDDEHLKEWMKVCAVYIENELWDCLVVGLCTKGKGQPLTEQELNILELMFIDCHE